MAPYDHADLHVQVAAHLAERGIVRPLTDNQSADGALPSVFVGLMDESPGPAVAVQTANVDQDEHDSNPVVVFTVTVRSKPGDLLGLLDLAGRVFGALQSPTGLRLTAGRGVLYCQRAITGATVPDGNQRHVRVDTYSSRVLVPRNA